MATAPIDPLGAISFLGRGAAAWNDWQSAVILDFLTHFLAVVSFVASDD
jgi:hypothetical protein